ncbi:MAG: metalloenzyme [Bacillota bacterium]
MSIIFIFVDGVGLGERNEKNPFFTTATPFFSSLLGGNKMTVEAAGKDYKEASLLALDARLALDGLPQSATGQTALFTGFNAAKLLGCHLNGFPNRALRGVLADHGIFLQLRRNSLQGTFANAYRPDFFDELKGGLKGYYSCSTLITYYGGLTFRSLDDLRRGEAVYMDITNVVLRRLGFDLPRITPQEAGERLVKIAGRFHLTLFEHFLTDIAGHNRDSSFAAETVTTLDAFLEAVVRDLPAGDLLLLTSDHGNLEDLTTKGHTANPVPALVVGKGRDRLVELLDKQGSITAVTPALLKQLTVDS